MRAEPADFFFGGLICYEAGLRIPWRREARVRLLSWGSHGGGPFLASERTREGSRMGSPEGTVTVLLTAEEPSSQPSRAPADGAICFASCYPSSPKNSGPYLDGGRGGW